MNFRKEVVMNNFISVLFCVGAFSLLLCWILIPISAYEVTYTYDDAGRLTGAQYEDGESISYTYDLTGNLTSKTMEDICVHHGDVDFNGSVTASDAQMSFYIVLGLLTPTTEEACAADCDKNGSITAGDTQKIFSMVFGLDSCADPI